VRAAEGSRRWNARALAAAKVHPRTKPRAVHPRTKPRAGRPSAARVQDPLYGNTS
jgi:hypothetical protein